jgi:hypothetical protein
MEARTMRGALLLSIGLISSAASAQAPPSAMRTQLATAWGTASYTMCAIQGARARAASARSSRAIADAVVHACTWELDAHAASQPVSAEGRAMTLDIMRRIAIHVVDDARGAEPRASMPFYRDGHFFLASGVTP